MHEQIKFHVSEAMAALFAAYPSSADLTTEAVYAQLWPYVREAVGAARQAMDVAPEPVPDKRAKPWQYVARFWENGPLGAELIGETDPEIMQGTGELPVRIVMLADELHGAQEHSLTEDDLRAKLPQLRNNLGRNTHATLRIEYRVEGTSYFCQVDVHRLA